MSQIPTPQARRFRRHKRGASQNSGGLASCPSFRHWWCSKYFAQQECRLQIRSVRARAHASACADVQVCVCGSSLYTSSAVDSRPPTTYVNTRLVDYTGDVYYSPYAIPNSMPSLPCCHTAVFTCKTISLHLSVVSGTGPIVFRPLPHCTTSKHSTNVVCHLDTPSL